MDEEEEVVETMYDASFADPVAARLDAIGVLLSRTELLTDLDLRKLGMSAVERGIRSLPTAKTAKVLPLAR